MLSRAGFADVDHGHLSRIKASFQERMQATRLVNIYIYTPNFGHHDYFSLTRSPRRILSFFVLDMNMLEAFKVKPFDLEPVLEQWKDGPVFKGNAKKDPPVEEWLEKIKAGCVERNIPEECWHRVAQHFMGNKAKKR